MSLKIFPTKIASKRTKERIQQHGPEFKILATSSSIQAIQKPCVLVCSTKDEWLGWLPADEVEAEWE